MNVTITPGKLYGEIDAMPSKSHAHRVLIAQKLAQLQGQHKPDSLIIPEFSEDISATKRCLAQLDNDVPYLDCGESGSTLRFMLPVAMALKSEAIFAGSGKLPQRPVSPLKEEMEAHGCTFHTANSDNSNNSDNTREIFTVRGRLICGDYMLPGNISSQFITGLLFALPILNGDSSITITTPLESSGYVAMTLDVLSDFGINISAEYSAEGFPVYKISGGQTYMEPDGLYIEGDWSNSAFWLACGALGGDITCHGLRLTSSQKDKAILNILEEMGAQTEITSGVNGTASVSCRNPEGYLKGIHEDVSQTPDLVPVMAAVMALAEGSSLITGAERLKIKESDRLLTVFRLISGLGGDITYGGTGLSLTGMPAMQGGEADSFNDHRIAMAAAVASCGCISPVTIHNAEAVRKSYPDFFKDFTMLGGKLSTDEQTQP